MSNAAFAQQLADEPTEEPDDTPITPLELEIISILFPTPSEPASQ